MIPTKRNYRATFILDNRGKDDSIEQIIEGSIQYGEQSSHLSLSPQKLREIQDRVGRAVGATDTPMVAMTSSSARFFLRQTVESALPNLSILAHNEIPAGVKVVSMGVIQ